MKLMATESPQPSGIRGECRSLIDLAVDDLFHWYRDIHRHS